MSIYVLGVDPGLANFGWAIVKLDPWGYSLADAGVFRTEKSDKKRSVLASEDNFVRARDIASRVSAICEKYEIVAICAESMSFPRSSAAAAKMAMTWGILATISDQRKVPLTQASPQEIKKLLCGKKDASKEEVEAEVKRRLGNFDVHIADIARSYREHAYDAASTILAAMDHSEVIRVVRQLLT